MINTKTDTHSQTMLPGDVWYLNSNWYHRVINNTNIDSMLYWVVSITRCNMEKFYITFSNPQGTFTLYYTIRDHSVAQLWKQSIKENFINQTVLQIETLNRFCIAVGSMMNWDSNHPQFD